MEISKAYHEFLRQENHMLREAVVSLKQTIKQLDQQIDRLRFIDDMTHRRDEVFDDIPF